MPNKETPSPNGHPHGHPAAHHSAEFVAAAKANTSRSDDGDAFVREPGGTATHSDDDLAEELAEDFISSATSGEDSAQEGRDAEVEEESGGPFIETSGETEFAQGTDAANPADAEQEAFPTATAVRKGLVAPEGAPRASGSYLSSTHPRGGKVKHHRF